MRELRDELHRIAGDAAGAAQPLPPREVMRRGARWRRQRTVRRAAAGLAVACVLVAAVIFSVPAVRQVILTRPVSSGSHATPSPAESSPHRQFPGPRPVPTLRAPSRGPGPQPRATRLPSPVPTRQPPGASLSPSPWPTAGAPSPVPTRQPQGPPSASPTVG
jgi:hypothetical protein